MHREVRERSGIVICRKMMDCRSVLRKLGGWTTRLNGCVVAKALRAVEGPILNGRPLFPAEVGCLNGMPPRLPLLAQLMVGSKRIGTGKDRWRTELAVERTYGTRDVQWATEFWTNEAV